MYWFACASTRLLKYTLAPLVLTAGGSKVLAGHVGHVAVQAHPAHGTVAGPGPLRLRAGATVPAAHLAAQLHKTLNAHKRQDKEATRLLAESAFFPLHKLVV